VVSRNFSRRLSNLEGQFGLSVQPERIHRILFTSREGQVTSTLVLGPNSIHTRTSADERPLGLPVLDSLSPVDSVR
jgi:hypothetical protein